MPWTLAVESSFPRGPCCFPTTCPYSCLGKEVEPRGKWVPGIVLEKEVWAGGRKENTGDGVGGGWFACCPDAVFLSFCDFRASHCGHLKAGSGLGQSRKALAASVGLGWPCPLAPNGGHILVWYTLVHMHSAPHKAWP